MPGLSIIESFITSINFRKTLAKLISHLLFFAAQAPTYRDIKWGALSCLSVQHNRVAIREVLCVCVCVWAEQTNNKKKGVCDSLFLLFTVTTLPTILHSCLYFSKGVRVHSTLLAFLPVFHFTSTTIYSFQLVLVCGITVQSFFSSKWLPGALVYVGRSPISLTAHWVCVFVRMVSLCEGMTCFSNSENMMVDEL